MVKKYRVHLTEKEQEELKGLVSKGSAASYRQTPARILLLCDENQDGGAMRDADIARVLKVGTATVEGVRRPLCGGGSGGGHRAQEATEPPPQEAGRRWRSPPDGLGLLPTARWPGRLDAASAG